MPYIHTSSPPPDPPPMNGCVYQRKIDSLTYRCYTEAEWQQLVQRQETERQVNNEHLEQTFMPVFEWIGYGVMFLFLVICVYKVVQFLREQ